MQTNFTHQPNLLKIGKKILVKFYKPKIRVSVHCTYVNTLRIVLNKRSLKNENNENDY